MSKIIAVCVAIVVLLSLGTTASGDAAERLAQYVIAGGGESLGGGFRVTGTIGQHSVSVLSGGNLVLRGGFWKRGGVLPTPSLTAMPTLTATASPMPTGTVTATPRPTATLVPAGRLYLPLMLRRR